MMMKTIWGGRIPKLFSISDDGDGDDDDDYDMMYAISNMHHNVTLSTASLEGVISVARRVQTIYCGR